MKSIISLTSVLVPLLVSLNVSSESLPAINSDENRGNKNNLHFAELSDAPSPSSEFAKCLQIKAKIVRDLQIDPEDGFVIVDSNNLKIHQYCHPDGSVILGCSRTVAGIAIQESNNYSSTSGKCIH